MFSQGLASASVSPSFTHHEMDPNVGQAMGLDDRDMLYIHTGSESGESKTMHTFSLFDVPIRAWAGYYGDKLGVSVLPTSLAVYEASLKDEMLDVDYSLEEALTTVYEGLLPYIPEEQRESIAKQFHSFIHRRDELLEVIDMYSQERLEFEKDLALSDKLAKGSVKRAILSMRHNASEERQAIFDAAETYAGEFMMSDELELAVWQMMIVSNFNRAGVAAGNERTIKRIEHSAGTEFLKRTQDFEYETLRLWQENNQIDLSRIDEASSKITETSLECGGGCPATVINEARDVVLSQKAREKGGLTGKWLYADKAMDKMAKCCSQPSIVADGTNKYCSNCEGTTVTEKNTDETKLTWQDRMKGITAEEKQNMIDGKTDDEKDEKPATTLEIRRRYNEERRAQFGTVAVSGAELQAA